MTLSRKISSTYVLIPVFISIILSLMLMVASCGQKGGQGEDYSDYAAKAMIEIPIVFSKQNENQGFNLAAPSNESPLSLFYGLDLTAAGSYVMTLSGCQSGLSGTVTTSTVKVYVGDSNCVLKLSSFVYNGNTYTPKLNLGFTTWLANDTSTFANTNNANDIFYVKVNSQLTQSLVSSNDTVSYSFWQAIAGSAQTVANTSLSQANNVSVSGQEAPNFVLSTNGSPAATGTLAPLVFSGVNSSGAPLMVFNLYCAVAMGNTGNCGLSTNDAGAIPLSMITYKLVEDTYGVNTGTALTTTQLGTIMSSGTSTINTSTDVLSDNNKGFKTSTLTGPGPLHSKPNMILILSDGTSYTYFSVQYQVISNN